jgi:hypothetical protein
VWAPLIVYTSLSHTLCGKCWEQSCKLIFGEAIFDDAAESAWCLDEIRWEINEPWAALTSHSRYKFDLANASAFPMCDANALSPPPPLSNCANCRLIGCKVCVHALRRLFFPTVCFSLMEKHCSTKVSSRGHFCEWNFFTTYLVRWLSFCCQKVASGTHA